MKYNHLFHHKRVLFSLFSFKLLVFFTVFLFTFILRAHNYEKMPSPWFLDEMNYAWPGIYLVETGTPVSWSTLGYPDSAEVYRGEISYHGSDPKVHVRMYSPWLDQPPLFSLLVGYSAHYFGADRTQYIPPGFIRFPTVLIAAITSLLIFLIARKLSGFWTGILSMLFYGTIPLFVFGSRLAMAENLIGLIFSLIVLLLLYFRDTGRWLYVISIPFLIGVAGLSKAPGFSLIFFFMIFAFIFMEKGKYLKKNLSILGILSLILLPFVGMFFWYGLHFDASIFWTLMDIQSNRPVGFSSLGWFFVSPSFGTSIMVDSWYIFCLLSFGYFLFQGIEKGKQIVLFAAVFWVLLVMLTGGAGDLLAWYRFGAFPFLAIIGVWGLQVLYKRADFFSLFIVAGLLLGGRHFLINPFRPNVTPFTYRFVTLSLLLSGVGSLLFEKKIFYTISRVLMVMVIVVGVYFNTVYIYNAFEIHCESMSCPLLPGTWLSRMHFPVLWRLLVLE